MTEKELLEKQISQVDKLKNQENFSSDFKAWKRKTASLIDRVFGPDSRQLKDFEDIKYSLTIATNLTPRTAWRGAYLHGLEDARAILESMVEELTEFNFDSGDSSNPYLFILTLLDHFHNVARQLRNRYKNRNTLDVADEYDVQDLLHALLKTKFDDIRAEEWSPSYAGKSSRMDFLLKDSGVVIETKRTRNGLKEGEIGDQLIIDIERYKKHPDCKKLICFVYDPEGLIGNPAGLSSDLTREEDGFKVEVVVRP